MNVISEKQCSPKLCTHTYRMKVWNGKIFLKVLFFPRRSVGACIVCKREAQIRTRVVLSHARNWMPFCTQCVLWNLKHNITVIPQCYFVFAWSDTKLIINDIYPLWRYTRSMRFFYICFRRTFVFGVVLPAISSVTVDVHPEPLYCHLYPSGDWNEVGRYRAVPRWRFHNISCVICVRAMQSVKLGVTYVTVMMVT